MDEPIRQDRRYKWFRPRQAARGAYLIASSTNHPTWMLYNNSSGAYLLVVRDVIAAVAGFIAVTAQQGTIGTHVGREAPMITGDAPKAGQVFYADSTTVITPDWMPPIENEQHDFPFAVLLPGWGLVVQDTAAAAQNAEFCSFIWEAIEPDELDWMF